ncbi:MAG: ATP-binding cassette domain-containing protein, partial [Clostridia bacterium]|nr:ATP-binding cassette domain-containing protein [Clostridia bacterium]
MTASAERIMEIEDLPDEEMRYETIDPDKLYSELSCIKVDNVSFAYDKEVIFKDASVNIEPNSLIVITGISGIGKSTLLKMILGILAPDSGQIRIELKDGVGYVADASMRSLFAYVPQGNMILSGTVRENITFMANDISEDGVIEAAKTACIYNVIKELPDGFDTVLGEGGCGLSEGQIQRLSVARALYSGSPVLLLDEATSALDEATEQQMLTNIKNSGKTCIIISHKECAVNMADCIITIEGGKINVL